MGRRILAGLLLMLGVATATSVSAHGLDPAVAYINNPTGVGNVIADDYLLQWVDADRSIPTGTATVDFFYTNRQPPTFLNGERPDDLVGEPIVQGIWEKELDNEYTWDVSGVPSGSYLLWSQVVEPEEENMAIQIIEFSPGILTVAHPGDPVHPAVFLTSPISPFQFADKTFDLTYSAFDPDGTARVKLEASQDPNGPFLVIADDLPATETATHTWDTSMLEDGDWILRATITDDRGLSFYHYARYFLLVTHAIVRPPDAGVVDAGEGARDGGPSAQRDAGVPTTPKKEDTTCSCAATRSREAHPAWVLLGLVIFSGRWRRRSRT